jgi:DNA-binding MarR family transcriptional regulator
MAEATDATQGIEPDRDIDNARIMLGLLDSVERDGGQSQRRLASELGIALGLVNAYLKRCVKKGLLKVNQAPARRYVYYLTPQGFAEKSRLTVEYLSYSFRFFRQAKADCAALLHAAHARGLNRVVFAGKSDLAEIAAICALDVGMTIVAVVDPQASEARFVGAPLVASWEGLREPFDAVVVTDLTSTRKTCEAVLTRFGPERLLVPALLRQRLRDREEPSS